METTLSLLPLAAPIALGAASLATSRPRPGNPGDPGGTLRAGELAAAFSFAIALLSGIAVLVAGSSTSPLLGVGGVGLSLRLDPLSATMFALVSFVGLLVVRYSRNYLDGDPRRGDFIGRLCLALAVVSLLVLAGNVAQLVAAWVAASFALHRLLLFFDDRPRARIAGRKKMIAARAGDVCLLAAVALLAQAFGSSDIATIASRASAAGVVPPGAGAAVWLLIAAAVLKSAQFPFHAWLSEVMETPTPVSALLHAGMINSGGFLILRFSDVVVLEPAAMTALAAVGVLTAVVGSLVMLTQTTIKGSLAHSTMAQMGFMMIECGLGAFSLAILHIVAHSLYKAHAFLSAGGAVIHPATASEPAPPAVGRRAAALGLVGGGRAAAWGGAPLAGPWGGGGYATAALASVLGFGVVIWVARQLASREHPAALLSALAIAVVAPTVFFALKTGADVLYGPGLAQAPASTAASILVLVLGVGAMGALAWLQLTGFPTGRWGQRAYAFIRNGAYVGALSDRLSGARRLRSTRGNDDRGSAEPVAGTYAPGPSRVAQETDAPGHDEVAEAVERAMGAVPPLWPLSDFVAVNPFLGLAGRRFEDASSWLERSAGARTSMPRSFYAAAIDRGEITREDLAAAVEDSAAGLTLDALERGARKGDRALEAAPTVADIARGITGVDAPRLVVERIGDWASGYFDRGQARWPSPWRHLSPYLAWRAQAALDRAPELLGLCGLRSHAAALPDSATEAIAVCVQRLGLETEELDLYFQRLLLRVGGWAGHLRYAGWSAELAGKGVSGVDELLAISLAWETALLAADPRIESAWHVARPELAAEPVFDAEREIDLALHRAFEIATQRQLSQKLSGAASPDVEETAAQVVFCIDVRSERLRRSLESVAPRVQTLGFAGFFGMAIEWIRLGEERGVASCPVLLEPGHAVRETSDDAERVVARRRFRSAAARAFGAFKSGAVSSFGFVETLGLAYGFELAARSLARVGSGGFGRTESAASRPDLGVERLAKRTIGIPLDERIDLAEGALRAMSLTEGFAPLVVLAAHGSSSVNNPFAAGLDCGACGGRTGEPNARVAAAILNDADVRAGLVDRGIRIPAETRFVAAVHDTTRDIVRLCDRDEIPAAHHAAVDQLEAWLARAGGLARGERAPSLGLEAGDDEVLFARATDWSQVRPEWGLAGCTSFIAAPRSHTAGKELGTSAFLHEYCWSEDRDFAVLEQIMTAPLVVASWINLQYFASTVDNRAFGAGDKVLHNVAGGLGVVEGNGGDLRVGLPLQSVHDGTRFSHRPSRLTAAVAAPCEAMTAVLEKHAFLRDLLDHGWICLVALDDTGRISHRYVGDSQWSALPSEVGGEADEVAA